MLLKFYGAAMKVIIENLHLHLHCPNEEVLEALERQETLTRNFMSTTQEQYDALAERLNSMSTKVSKILAESEAARTYAGELKAMIEALQAQQPSIDFQPLIDKIDNDIMPALEATDAVNPDPVV